MNAQDHGAQYDSMGHNYAGTNQAFFKDTEDPARLFIRKWIPSPKGRAILDMGCGHGEDLAFYQTLPFAAVYGVEPSKVSVEAAALKMRARGNDHVWQGDFENAHILAGSIDIVTARYSPHYVLPANMGKAYAEIARILRPGGLFVFAADHPTASAVVGRKFQNEGVTFVKIKLYDGKVEIKFPLHSFCDYFSPEFLRLFQLIGLEEAVCPEHEYQDGPNGLFVAARKK